MTTADDMVGPSAAFSWTHSNPIWINLTISLLELGSTRIGSMSSITFPSHHSTRAWKVRLGGKALLPIAQIKSEIWCEHLSWDIHTYERRLCSISCEYGRLFLFPLIISSKRTPKLKTSYLTENRPFIAYSGAMYPLFKTNMVDRCK